MPEEENKSEYIFTTHKRTDGFGYDHVCEKKIGEVSFISSLLSQSAELSEEMKQELIIMLENRVKEKKLCGRCSKPKGETPESCNCGRPPTYGEEILKKADEYLNRKDELDKDGKLIISRLPTRGGLAIYLGVSRDTLYEWAREHKEFSDIMEWLGAIQEDDLINQGLSGRYNSTIAKVLLTKHGYTDKIETDITSKGESINPVLVKFIDGGQTDNNRDTKGV